MQKMMWKLLGSAACLALMALAFIGLSACNDQAPKDLAAVQAQVMRACGVIEPTLASLQATAVTPEDQAKFDKLASIAALACSAPGGKIDVTSLHGIVQTAIPEALKAITQSKLPDADKQRITFDLMAFQVAVSAAIAEYGK